MTVPGGWQTRLDATTVARYRATGDWDDRTIADRLDAVAVAEPDRPLIYDGDTVLTAAGTAKRAMRLARLIAGLGVARGEVVSFQLPNWHEAILVDLACAYGGFVSNPIVPIYRDAEVGFIVASAGSRLLFATGAFRNFDYAAMIERLRPKWPRLIEPVFVRGGPASALSLEGLFANGAEKAVERPEANDIKLLMYTSGTTGQAKGVLHTHNTLGAEIRNFIRHLRLPSGLVVLMPSPLTHITGYLYGLMLPVTLGGSVVLMERWDVAAAADLIERHGVSFTLGATPFLQELSRFARDTGRRFPSLLRFPTGGAPVPPEIVQEAMRSFANCRSFRIYGSTEAPTVALGVPDPGREDLAATTEGYVVGHELRLVDDHDHPVADGEEGEVTTRGPENFVGYANPADNGDAFSRDGFFRTGDLARLTPEGCLVVTGRKKDLIIRGGENLSPKEVEDVLHAHPAVREAAVVAMPHARLGETGCAFVTLHGGARFAFADMTAHLERSGLARQKFPERLEIVESLPYTVAGKIRKNLLRADIRARLANENGKH